MTEFTLSNVQLLLDRPKGEGMIVSCYVDLSLAGVAALLSREGPWEPVASGLRVEKRIQP